MSTPGCAPNDGPHHDRADGVLLRTRDSSRTLGFAIVTRVRVDGDAADLIPAAARRLPLAQAPHSSRARSSPLGRGTTGNVDLASGAMVKPAFPHRNGKNGGQMAAIGGHGK